MNSLHDNLLLSLIEAGQFADRCAYETLGDMEVGEAYADIHEKLMDLVRDAIELGAKL